MTSSDDGPDPDPDQRAQSWLRATPVDALRDLWSVYEANLEAVELGVLEYVLQHRELARLVPADSGPALMQIAHDAGVRLRSAIRGDWAPFQDHLSQRGALHADFGISFHASCDQARAFMRPLVPRLVERYAADGPRLCGVLQAMHAFAEYRVAVIADAYLDRMDASIRARDEDLATTLDSIGDAVIVTDQDGRVTRMNPVAERLTGFTLAEARHRPLPEVFRIEHESTHEPVESPVIRVLREGIVVGLANHTVLVSRDGKRCPIADSGAPIRRDTGEIRGVVLVFRDVTEDRRNEDALRHWERIFQHATWGVALASASEIKFEAVNPAYAEMHGYTVEELMGAPVSKLWAPETRADMERHAHETLDHSRLVVETTHLCKDGRKLPVEVIGTTIKDASGKVVSFVANVQDITERKRLQQSQMRAIELEAENLRIEQANRLKSEFLANMSHELRTPLNSIIGFTELLHDEQVGPLAPQQKEFLGEILSGGLHLLRLINDVLDLAKVEAGKMDFRPEPIELAPMIGTVAQSLFATASRKRLQIDVEVDPGLTDIVLDPVRFKQLLYNYVSNALKFTPDGGRVVVRAFPEAEDTFRLEVEDTGPGIPEDDASRLFVPFQQLDSGATKRHGGTGLGLALTKRLAEAQGGSVGMRPAPERGSIFFAVLPRRPVGAAGPGRRADVPTATTVLVVESDPAERAVVVGILKDAGYAVSAVATAEDAVAAWQDRPYDALTLSFPPASEDINGLLQHVRDDRRRPNVPVIALALVSDRNAAAGFAVTDVLARPVDSSALLAALEHSGAPPARGRPVVVVDDDPGSLKLMEVTLAKLGYEALCFSHPPDALHALQTLMPAAIIVDLLMPNMDGFAFLERVRASPDGQRIPVVVWTVKDLSADERRRLHDAAAQVIVQKGGGDPLSAVLEQLLPARSSTAERAG